MTVVIAQPNKREVQKEIRAMKEASREILSSPAKARNFLIKNGFITKDKKLHPNYR
jgi:hypothetical protein